jgi:hypothetical protein
MTALPSAAVSQTSAVQRRAWPIDQTRYDRRIGLSGSELEALQAMRGDLLIRARGEDHDLSVAPWRSIGRLVRPLQDAQAALRWDRDARRGRNYARTPPGWC